MSHFVVVRCRTEEDAQEVLDTLVMEYKNRGVCPVVVGQGADRHYAASDVAEDSSKIKLLTIDPETEDDEEIE